MITSFLLLLNLGKKKIGMESKGFCLVHLQKRKILNRIVGIEKGLTHNPSNFLVELKSQHRQELEIIVDREEILWKTKSKAKWIKGGERNTKYDHALDLNRSKNKIKSLEDLVRNWIDDF